MVLKSLSSLILTLSLSISTYAQSDNCPCCTENHATFNFCIGDWIVYDTTGNIIGENRIFHLEDKCIIYENWTGSLEGTGKSFAYFNSKDSTWNKLWLDNKGSNLILKGKAEKNKVIFYSDLAKGGKLGWYKNRITWTLNEDNSVRQQWDYLDKDGELLSVAFVGI